MNKRLALALTALFILGTTATAHSAVWHVANNGVDGPLCGSREAPCRSISAAIAKAAEFGDRIVVGPGRYGDVNGDGDFNDPGDEAAELQGGIGCDCLLHVNKSITVESAEGAGATVLDAGGRAFYVVRISIGHVVFGTRNRGFTLVGGHTGVHIATVPPPPFRPLFGIRLSSNRSAGQVRDGFSNEAITPDLKIVDNVAAANGIGGFSFGAVGQSSEVTGNIATDNGFTGFQIVGSDLLPGPGLIVKENFSGSNGRDGFALRLEARNDISMNVASHNGRTGFALAGPGSARARNNAAIANDGFGFAFREGGRVDLRRSAIHGNRLGGILTEMSASTSEIAHNNIFGNGAAANCGLINATADVLTVGKNFWGAPGGPGPDPADAICDVAPATTVLDGIANEPYETPVTVGR